MMTEVFWTLLVVSVIGFLTLLAKMCFKSKCDQVSCCCLTIHRRTEEENDEKVEV